MYDVQRAFQLVSVDTMGPISPQVLGGYNYVTTFVYQHPKWKEIFFTKEKTQTVNYLDLFNKGLVCSLGSSQGGQRYGVYELCVQTVLS